MAKQRFGTRIGTGGRFRAGPCGPGTARRIRPVPAPWSGPGAPAATARPRQLVPRGRRDGTPRRSIPAAARTGGRSGPGPRPELARCFGRADVEQTSSRPKRDFGARSGRRDPTAAMRAPFVRLPSVEDEALDTMGRGVPLGGVQPAGLSPSNRDTGATDQGGRGQRGDDRRRPARARRRRRRSRTARRWTGTAPAAARAEQRRHWTGRAGFQR